VFLAPGLASSSSQVQYEATAATHDGPPASRAKGCTSDSSRAKPIPGSRAVTRGGAFLRSFDCTRLRREGGLETYATASLRGDPGSVVLGRLTAGLQTISPSACRSGLPIGLLPLDEDIEVEAINGSLWVPPGTLVLLAPDQEWRIALNRTVPIVVLSLSDSVLNGRLGCRPFSAARRLQPDGFAAVFIKLVETAAAEMDALSTAEWQALEQSIVDLFLTIVAGVDRASAAATPSLVALFNRVALAIERPYMIRT
jgi:AraC-binding-like domain